MKISFVSNLFNHHQKYVSDKLFDITDKKYSFIATMGMPQQLKSLGYERFNDIPYVLNAFESKEMEEYAKKQIDTSDVVIYGSAPYEMIDKYKHEGKLLFMYSERPLKKGNEYLKYIPRLIKWRVQQRPSDNTYMLCSSAFTALDFSKYGMYKNKTYKWGYFPETRYYNIDALLKRKKLNKILWFGRFLDWKHPEDAVIVAKKLKSDGYNFSLDIGGTGELESKLHQMAQDFQLEDCVTFLGPVPSEMVRKHMEEAGIYLFTSDRYEGWGAVLNESMNSACSVIVSDAVGAAPYLVNHKENGMIYHSGKLDELYETIKFLLDNPEEQLKLGRNAYSTIIDEWNAEEAAERLVELSEHILAGEKYPDLYKTGPCSRANIVKDGWFDECR